MGSRVENTPKLPVADQKSCKMLLDMVPQLRASEEWGQRESEVVVEGGGVAMQKLLPFDYQNYKELISTMHLLLLSTSATQPRAISSNVPHKPIQDPGVLYWLRSSQ